MRAAWFGMVVACFMGSTAFAQDVGDTVWVTGDTPSVRFVGERTPGPTFTEGTRLTVLAEQDGQVRVFTAERFGWVPRKALTTEAPEGAVPPGFQLKLPSGP
ncbi:MAG: hypothetical protein H6733_07715 [Alphaproteobacteria bacterium]|nr:hypothetical protein [Alphaproteobacteria bacterium]